MDALRDDPSHGRPTPDVDGPGERLRAGSRQAEKRLDDWILTPGRTGALVRLIVPLSVFLTTLAMGVYVMPDRATEIIVRTSAVVLIGKIAAAGATTDFWFWVAVLGTADVIIGLFILLNFDHLKGLPRFGYYIRGMEKTGIELCDRHPWVRRLSILGIAIVVFIPIHGTGTITGSLMGRILGLGPLRTLTSVVLGSYPGVILILGGTEAVEALFRAHWGLALGGTILIIGALVLGFYAFNRSGNEPEDVPK